MSDKIRKILTRVTLTGADDSVDPKALADLSKTYPFVEFGILLSKASEGRPRFPSRAWLDKFLALNLPAAGHVCGQWVRDIFQGQWPAELTAKPPAVAEPAKAASAKKGDKTPEAAPSAPALLIMPGFKRWQFNTHAIRHAFSATGFAPILKRIGEMEGTVIFQRDDINNELPAIMLNQMGFKNVASLSDLSHGAGMTPGSWPKPYAGIEPGYAGGLGVHNLTAELEKIAEAVGDGNCWIDAESHLRTDDNKTFELSKAVAFLNLAVPWVK